ncbi:MAG: DJ-1/PfpI family protein [Chloroflexota bacterium]
MNKQLTGKRVAILTAHEFEDIEVMYTVLQLSQAGAKLVVGTLPQEAPGHFHGRPAWPGKPITGRFGHTIPFDVLEEGNRYTVQSIWEMNPDEYDAVVFPGGLAPDFLRVDDKTLTFTAAIHNAGKVVAAICHGPQVLISLDRQKGTDTVRGRNVTAYCAVTDDLMNAGATYHDVPAITDGNVVTGRIPDDLPEFCDAIVEALVA